MESKELNKADALFETDPMALACVFDPEVQSPGKWRLSSVLPMELIGDLSATPDGAVRLQGKSVVCGPMALRLTRDEAEGYILNLDSPEPSFFCLVRFEANKHLGVVPVAREVTLSYNQAARWMDGGEQTDRVAAPEEILPWLAEFAELHFEAPEKKKRKGPKPSFMIRREFDAMAQREAGKTVDKP